MDLPGRRVVRPSFSLFVALAACAAVNPSLAEQAQESTRVSADQARAADTAAGAADIRIFGVLDTGLRHVKAATGGDSQTQFASGLNTSRFGLRAGAILEDELKATLRLESGFNPANGAQSNSNTLFDRTASAGVTWHRIDVRAGRQEGFGYELAAQGASDPLAMALNLPNFSSPAAARSRAPVLGANPLQAVYSYTYGQLRFNDALRVSDTRGAWTLGALYALGGVAGHASADTARAGHVGWHAQDLRVEILVQQSLDLHDNRSNLAVVAGSWRLDAWTLQAGVHKLKVSAGFDSTTLGNGASGTGILGSSTTVAPALAGPHQVLRYQVADFGATWSPLRDRQLTVATYRTNTDGAGPGASFALIGLGKWFLSPRLVLYLEADHAAGTGVLGRATVSGGAVANAFMAGVNLRY